MGVEDDLARLARFPDGDSWTAYAAALQTMGPGLRFILERSQHSTPLMEVRIVCQLVGDAVKVLHVASVPLGVSVDVDLESEPWPPR